MDYYEDFFTALEEAISRAGNVSRLSKMAGIPLNSMTRWRNRERVPSLESIVPLIPFIDWPKRGQSNLPPLIKPIGGNAPAEPVVGSDLVRIPILLKAGAGTPIDFWDNEPERWIEILPRFAHENIRGVEVNGDSMEPTIRDGSIVGVVPFDGNFMEGKIYLCRIPYFGLVIKRVRMDGMKGIILISDNKAYDDMHIPFEDCESLVVGRVVWHLQEA